MGADSGECIWVFATVHSCREHVGPQFTAWGASHCLWGAGGGRGSVPACRPPGRRPRTVGLRPRTAEAGVGRHLGGPRRRVPPGAREGPFCSPPDVRVVLHTQLDREQHEQVLARSDSLSQRLVLAVTGPRPSPWSVRSGTATRCRCFADAASRSRTRAMRCTRYLPRCMRPGRVGGSAMGRPAGGCGVAAAGGLQATERVGTDTVQPKRKVCS